MCAVQIFVLAIEAMSIGQHSNTCPAGFSPINIILTSIIHIFAQGFNE